MIFPSVLALREKSDIMQAQAHFISSGLHIVHSNNRLHYNVKLHEPSLQYAICWWKVRSWRLQHKQYRHKTITYMLLLLRWSGSYFPSNVTSHLASEPACDRSNLILSPDLLRYWKYRWAVFSSDTASSTVFRLDFSSRRTYMAIRCSTSERLYVIRVSWGDTRLACTRKWR